MNNLVLLLLNRQVVVQSHVSKVYERLLAVSGLDSRPDHKPCLMLLEMAAGPVLVRDWKLIAFDGRL